MIYRKLKKNDAELLLDWAETMGIETDFMNLSYFLAGDTNLMAEIGMSQEDWNFWDELH